MQPDPTHGAGVSITRSVSRWERALLAQWFVRTDRNGEAAVVAAYVSESSQDDPRLRNMIVIAERTPADINYLIHRPIGETAWIVSTARTGDELGRFRTLPEALNTIRPYRTQAAAPMLAVRDAQLTDATNER